MKKNKITNNNKMQSKKNKKLLINSIVFLLFILMFCGTHAIINVMMQGTKKQIIKSGQIEIYLFEDNDITIANAFPLDDEVGMIQEEKCVFRLVNKGTVDVNYKIKMVEEETGTLKKSDVRYGLIKNEEIPKIDFLSNSEDNVIDEGIIKGNNTVNEYQLRLWIRYDLQNEEEVKNKFLKFRLQLEVTQIIEENMNDIPLNQLILSNETELTNGEDGLYSYQDIYYYSGENVNNYIWYNCQDGHNSGRENCEIWRILTIEADGSVKIIKNEPLEQQTIAAIENETNFWYENTHTQDQYKIKNMIVNGKVMFDHRRRRPASEIAEDNSYCIYSSNGCNAFSANITKGSYLDLIVDVDSSIKMYLENLYYEYVLTDSAKDALQVSEYNIGIIDIDIGKDIDSIYSNEKNIKCNSKVALLNVSNYVLASKNTNCRNNFLESDCTNDNWLNSNIEYMFLNGKRTGTNAQIFLHDKNGLITTRDANYEMFLIPVITLKPTTIANGSGNSVGDYYKIVN